MKYSFIALAALLSFTAASAKIAQVQSPDATISASLVVDDSRILLSVDKGTNTVLAPSQLSLDIRGVNKATQIKKVKKAPTVSEKVQAHFYRQAEFSTSYNSVIAQLDNGIQIEVRAFDEGIAYRYITTINHEVIVEGEKADFTFDNDYKVWLPYSTNDDKPMAMAYQNVYDYTNLSHANDKLAFLPATVDYGNGMKLTITESDLESYPGMFLKADTTAMRLSGVFAPYPRTTDYYKWRRQQYVTSTEDYIARTTGSRTWPWRVLAITTDDRQMPVNNMVYALASECRIADTSWIHGGKVAWDWWNDWGLRDVDFEAGINTATYKAYIDFAARYNLEYVILDEGWYESASGDMLKPIDDIDLPELISYANERGVGLVLWCVFNVLDERLDEICSKYSSMGIKGFKVDFLDRDDQTAVEMAYRLAEGCARHHLLLDYHGIYKPTGINRTYPNILNFESVFGMEEARWTTPEHDMPLYDVTFPYIRLLAGYVDYTPGAMRNGSQRDWQANYYSPISQGTRCHQIAAYIVYDSPFTMLCDSPSNYDADAKCTRFIADIPTNIDQTIVLAGEIGKYIVTARRAGDDWWIGGMTNWSERAITLDFSFLPEGKYKATIVKDGANASRFASDYKITQAQINNKSTLSIDMKQGGGFAIHLTNDHD